MDPVQVTILVIIILAIVMAISLSVRAMRDVSSGISKAKFMQKEYMDSHDGACEESCLELDKVIRDMEMVRVYASMLAVVSILYAGAAAFVAIK